VCSFWTDTASGFVGGLAASLIALYVAYRFVDSRLHLRQRRESEAQQEAARREMRQAVLSAVHRELEANAATVQVLLTELPKGGIPYPGFDLTGWPLVSQASVFTALQTETISALTHVYNRMTSANDQLSFVADLNHGPTGILVNTVLAEGLDKDLPLAHKAYELFVNHREGTREMLIERVAELKRYADDAIDAVEAELGIRGVGPAAMRHYVRESAAI
jgi:hypothetical protein